MAYANDSILQKKKLITVVWQQLRYNFFMVEKGKQ
jgi:hypothetical protein